MSQGITVKGKTSQDKNVPILVDDQGRVYVLLTDGSGTSIPYSPTTGYGVSNIEETATYKYFGFENKDGAWYIMRKTLATNEFLYFAGTTDYPDGWDDRATHAYDYYSEVF